MGSDERRHRDAGVAAEGGVDHLGDAEVHGHRRQRVGVVALRVRGGSPSATASAWPPSAWRRPARRRSRGCTTHRRLQQRRGDAEVGSSRHLDACRQRRLDRGAADLAVTLREVRVADVQHRARRRTPGSTPWRPAPIRQLSTLPPKTPGRDAAEWRPGSAGATPITPKCGRTGTMHGAAERLAGGRDRAGSRHRGRRSSGRVVKS